MKKIVVTALAAIGTLGLASSALAQSNNNGAQGYNNNPGYNNNQGYNGAQPYNNNTGNNSYAGYNHTQLLNGQGYNNANQAEVDTPNTQVRLAQVLLSSMGLYNGAIDGLDGQATSQAISEFQARHRLRQTGQLDPATLATVRRMTSYALEEESRGMQSGRASSENSGGMQGNGMQGNGMQGNGPMQGNGGMQNQGGANNGNGNP